MTIRTKRKSTSMCPDCGHDLLETDELSELNSSFGDWTADYECPKCGAELEVSEHVELTYTVRRRGANVRH